METSYVSPFSWRHEVDRSEFLCLSSSCAEGGDLQLSSWHVNEGHLKSSVKFSLYGIPEYGV